MSTIPGCRLCDAHSPHRPDLYHVMSLSHSLPHPGSPPLSFLSPLPPPPPPVYQFPSNAPTRQLNNQSMTRPLGALAALCLLGPCLGHAHGQKVVQRSPRRRLQSGVAGTAVYVEMTKGDAILALQEDGSAIVVSIPSSSQTRVEFQAFTLHISWHLSRKLHGDWFTSYLRISAFLFSAVFSSLFPQHTYAWMAYY